MKKNNIHIVLLLLISLSLFAFDGPQEPYSKRHHAYFACTFTDNMQIDAATFKQLMNQPICAKDSQRNIYRVKSFSLIYAERGLYQDDEGLPIIYTDYSSEDFTGDTLTNVWKKNFNDRLYKGDTIYLEKVLCTNSEKKNFLCKTIKLIIK